MLNDTTFKYGILTKNFNFKSKCLIYTIIVEILVAQGLITRNTFFRVFRLSRFNEINVQ